MQLTYNYKWRKQYYNLYLDTVLHLGEKYFILVCEFVCCFIKSRYLFQQKIKIEIDSDDETDMKLNFVGQNARLQVGKFFSFTFFSPLIEKTCLIKENNEKSHFGMQLM